MTLQLIMKANVFDSFSEKFEYSLQSKENNLNK